MRPCSTTLEQPRGSETPRLVSAADPSTVRTASAGWLQPLLSAGGLPAAGTGVSWPEGRWLSSETTFHSGTEFLGYRLEQLIGQGGMGVVLRAYDRRLKRTVAVKFITPELALDERFRERFLRESELAAAVEHPNAVPIHDAGDVDGRLYLAMRYVEGSDLGGAARRSDGPLDPARGPSGSARRSRARWTRRMRAVW